MTSSAPRWALPAALGASALVLVGALAVVPFTRESAAPAAAPASASRPVVASPAVTPSPTPAPSPLPDPEVLAKKLAKVSRSGIGVSGIVVLDPSTGVVLNSRGNRPLVPASSLKVLTVMAALDALGPQARFTTSVVRPSRGALVLVGGGDPLLVDKRSTSSVRPASLQDLAKKTVAALKADGVTKVSLGYDTSLFSGPSYAKNWPSNWKSFTPRITPLMIDSGKLDAWRAAPDPARTTADAFAARLRKAGIKVTTLTKVTADADAEVVASAQSAPLSSIVRHTIRESNNVAAEVIARHMALAQGGKGSFAGATAALRDWLVARGLWAEGMKIDDGSGISARSKVTPAVLARAIAMSLSTPAMAAVVEGLPVAGVSGTLKDRFADPPEKAGRKVVHAKTGTLPGVATLAGWVTTEDGARLAFAAMANKTSGKATAYNWLDRSASVLARCGCR